MPLIQQALAAIIIGWLPGAVLFRIPLGRREQRFELPIEERVFWQILTSLVLALSLVLTLAWFERYEFRAVLIGQALISLAPALIWRQRLRVSTAAARVRPVALLPLVLIALCVPSFLPPSEYIIAGKDPGTYVGEGIQIAQRGSLVTRDTVVAAVPAQFRDLFFPSHGRDDYYSVRFMGFWIQDPDAGLVVGQFPHLFPAALALGYGFDGLTGVRRTTPVLAVLGILAVYFTATRIFGHVAGFAAALLLLLNVVQVWFARYPNTEILMQVLVFAAILAVLHERDSDDGWFAAAAGGILGLLFFLRFDAVLVVGAVVVALVLERLAGGRFSWRVVAALLPVTVLAVPYLVGPMRGYSAYPIAFVGNMPFWQHGILIALAGAGLLLLRLAGSSPAVRQGVITALPVVLAAACCGAGLYALYLREPAGRLAVHDAYALRMFANFYVTVPAVLGAILGFAVFVRGWFWRAPVFYVLVAIFAGFFFYKIRIVPDHFWAARRFLPVILPATLMLVAAIAVGGRKWGPPWLRIGRLALGIAFLALLANGYVRAASPVRAHVEYEGLIPQLERLAARFEDDDLVILESRDAGSDTHVFGLPLAYIYARNVLVIDSARPDKGLLAEFVTWADTRYDAVYFVGAGGTDLLSFGYAVEPILSERFQVPEYDSARNGYPRGVRRKEFEYGIYRFAAASPRETGPFDLDVGSGDNLHVQRFHAAEQMDGRTFRWTGPQSFVSVTSIPDGPSQLVLIAGDGGRPQAAPPARIEVALAGDTLGVATITGGFSAYAFPIPPALARRVAEAPEPSELRIRTTTWNPAVVLGTGDDRELGVMLDRVTIK